MLGLVTYWRQIPSPLKLLLILYPLSIILVFVTARYRTPLIPVMSVTAAAGLMSLVTMIRRLCWRRLVIVGICGFGIILLSSLPGPFPEEMIDYEAELYANVGATQLRRQRYESAVEHLKKSLQIMPKNGMAHANFGGALLKLGKTQEALKHSEEALRYKPDSPEILNNLGMVMSSMGRLDEAIEYYQRALKINPRHSTSHLNLGNAFAEQEKFDQAAAHFEKAVQINPRYTKAYIYLGHAYYKLGRLQQATKSYEKAMQSDPESSEARKNVAWMYDYYAKKLIRQDKLTEAATYFQQAVDTYPLETNYHIRLAKTLVRLGRYDQAAAVLKKAIAFMSKIEHKEAAADLQKNLQQINAQERPPDQSSPAKRN
jgi:tetratricopeptide (TPR) repeat protein